MEVKSVGRAVKIRVNSNLVLLVRSLGAIWVCCALRRFLLFPVCLGAASKSESSAKCSLLTGNVSIVRAVASFHVMLYLLVTQAAK